MKKNVNVDYKQWLKENKINHEDYNNFVMKRSKINPNKYSSFEEYDEAVRKQYLKYHKKNINLGRN